MNHHLSPDVETPHLANVQILQMTDAPLAPVCYTEDRPTLLVSQALSYHCAYEPVDAPERGRGTRKRGYRACYRKLRSEFYSWAES
jgi:hypothetical protein